jgi:four helix bundle protein
MNATDLQQRVKTYSYDCIDVALRLPNTVLGRHINGQLTRCASSAAVNYRAVRHAQSKRAFVAKLSIVVEESDESEFWLQMILDKIFPNDQDVLRLLREDHELTSIMVKSRLTASKSLNKEEI